MARYLATGERRVLGRRIEIDGLHADGSVFPVELAIAEVRLADRRLFTAYLRDISERRRAEQALQDSERRYRAVVEDQTELISRYNAVSPDLLQPRKRAPDRRRARAIEGHYFFDFDPGTAAPAAARGDAGVDAGEPDPHRRKREGTAMASCAGSRGQITHCSTSGDGGSATRASGVTSRMRAALNRRSARARRASSARPRASLTG